MSQVSELWIGDREGQLLPNAIPALAAELSAGSTASSSQTPLVCGLCAERAKCGYAGSSILSRSYVKSDFRLTSARRRLDGRGRLSLLGQTCLGFCQHHIAVDVGKAVFLVKIP